MLTRRRFLAAAASAAVLPAAAAAIEPIRRTGKPHMRLSIAGYSYRKYLSLQKPSMTLLDFAELAAQLGCDAIEPTAYYFPETSPQYLAKLKGTCTRLGLDISGSAVGNDFCVADPAKLRAQIDNTKKWIEYTSLLGGKTLRIFAGNVPKGDSEDKARARCIEAIQEVCDHSARFGVYAALENHGGIVTTAEQMLAIIKAVKHDWFGVNLDSGNFHSADPYADLAKIAPYAVVAQLKTEIRRAGAAQSEEADLPRLVNLLREVNYRGYVVLEYEAAEEPKEAIPRHLATLKKLLAQAG